MPVLEGELLVGGVGGKGHLVFVYGSVDAQADAYYAVGGGFQGCCHIADYGYQ